MGRGRAKAKQTKVARQLKYSSSELDVDKLSVELGAADAHLDRSDTVEDDPYDPYAQAYGDADSGR
jgi:hypothetical protein